MNNSIKADQAEQITTYDVAIIGSGPAGLSTAIQLSQLGVSNIIVLERSDEAGGNPRHCGHSPFGMREFKRVYLGPKYAEKMVQRAQQQGINIALNSTVTNLGQSGLLSVSTPQGTQQLQAKAVVISTGIREMPRAPRFVSGQRPNGIMTTGALQSLVYLRDQKPFSRPVIIGSELVAFSAIASCRHAGIKPVALVEENARISAYQGMQWVPRLLGMDVLMNTRIAAIQGKRHVTGVEVINAAGQTRQIDCDGVIFTGRFTPEASLIRMGNILIDPKTQGPVVDQYGRCSDPCYFATGNVLRPVETGGWCWQEGTQTAQFVTDFLAGKLPSTDKQINVVLEGEADNKLKYIIPQRISLPEKNTVTPSGMAHFQLRLNQATQRKITITANQQELASRNIKSVPERRLLISQPDWTALSAEQRDVGEFVVRLSK